MPKKPGRLRSEELLYVIAPLTNPVRYHSRYRLFSQFMERMGREPNVCLYVVEVAFGDRDFELTQSRNPQHVQLRSSHELWLKENAINLAIARLPPEAQYIAWIDGDVQFTHPHWVTETLHQLQHYSVVQLWQNAIELGPTGNALKVHTGFGYLHTRGEPYTIVGNPGHYGSHGVTQRGARLYAHPGYAWGARKEAIDGMGGLLDFAVAGSGDHHVSCSLVGRGAVSVPQGVSASYRDKVLLFEERCERHIRRNIGHVDGTIVHFWHGPKTKRGYWSRWDILKKGFDPERDLRRDHQGLWQLEPHHIELRDDLRAYFRSRHEDDIRED